MKPTTRFLAVVAMIGWIHALPAIAATVDHGQYARLLDRHVAGGRVDYHGVKTDEALLDAYLETLAVVPPQSLSPPEQFAFYVNAYNAWTIKLILSRYPDIRSIKDLGGLFSSPWKKKIARIDGALLTLDQIEHEILRKQFKDPRVHFAVNCASMGCPPLQSTPFTGAQLEAQLDRAARAFINDPHFNRLVGNTLWLSKIFRWFAEDFGDDVLGYVATYAEGALGERLAGDRGALRVKYLDYDWSLNDVKGDNHGEL